LHWGDTMSDKVYKKIEVVGCSTKSMQNAVELAVAKASESLRGLSWFEVKEIRGAVQNAKLTEWQVTVLAGFRLE